MSAASASFTLGPFTKLVSGDDLDRFVETARAGERLCYAQGLVEPRRDAVWLDAQGLAQGGGFTLSCERKDGERFWYIIRTAAAAPVAASGGFGRRARGTGGEAMTSEGELVVEAIYRTLRRAANLGLACPSNADLARAAELPSADAARHHVRRLLEDGRITIESNGPCARRICVAGVGWTLPTAAGK